MEIQRFSGVYFGRATSVDSRHIRRIGLLSILAAFLIAVFPSGGVRGQSPQTQLPPPTPEPMLASTTTRLGISYIGLLAMDRDPRIADYTWLRRYGYNLIRIWATWSGTMPGEAFGSLVTSTGDIRGGSTGTLASNFVELLRQALQNDWVIDISFDVDEFRAIGGSNYGAYKTGILKVGQLVGTAGLQDKTDYSSRVIFDVANEGINAKKTPTDGKQFLSVWKLGGVPSSYSWTDVLTELLNVPRAVGVPGSFQINHYMSFFSMKAVRDSDNNAAKYYNAVYKNFAGLTTEMRPLLAPHFVRTPCPHGWATLLPDRIAYMYAWNNKALSPFKIYLQEENRRGVECCVNKDPCPSMDTLTPLMPEVTGCVDWPPRCETNCSGCKLNCDSLEPDFKESGQNAQKAGAYAWIFHTYAGTGCGPNDQQIKFVMDAEERRIAEDANTWW